MQAPTISVGLADPKETLTPIIVAGISVIHEVFKAKKVHMAVEASTYQYLIAAFPAWLSFKGVAALPSQNISAKI